MKQAAARTHFRAPTELQESMFPVKHRLRSADLRATSLCQEGRSGTATHLALSIEMRMSSRRCCLAASQESVPRETREPTCATGVRVGSMSSGAGHPRSRKYCRCTSSGGWRMNPQSVQTRQARSCRALPCRGVSRETCARAVSLSVELRMPSCAQSTTATPAGCDGGRLCGLPLRGLRRKWLGRKATNNSWRGGRNRMWSSHASLEATTDSPAPWVRFP